MFRNIVAWERVLYDEALVVVPDDLPVCLGCMDKVNLLYSLNAFVKTPSLKTPSINNSKIIKNAITNSKINKNIISYGKSLFLYINVFIMAVIMMAFSETHLWVYRVYWSNRGRDIELGKTKQSVLFYMNTLQTLIS